MTPAELLARRAATQQAFYRRFEGIDLDHGVYASVTPGAPDRSLFNAVTYVGDPAAVEPRLSGLAAMYEEAGVRAWTVWVQPGGDDLARALEAAGHKLDGTPAAMGATLDSLDLDCTDAGTECPWDDVVAINEAAYGMPAGGMSGAGELADVHRYSTDGRAVVGVIDHEGDAGIVLVATRPEAQRRGLATALMRQGLRDARDRGCTTTTLEATAKGRPVYERLGYRTLGTLQMWERRRAAP